MKFSTLLVCAFLYAETALSDPPGTKPHFLSLSFVIADSTVSTPSLFQPLRGDGAVRHPERTPTPSMSFPSISPRRFAYPLSHTTIINADGTVHRILIPRSSA